MPTSEPNTLLTRYATCMAADELSGDTIATYVGNLMRVDAYMLETHKKTILSDYLLLTKEHFATYIATLSNLTAPTVNGYIWALRSYYRFLGDIGEVPANCNPALSLKIHEDRRDPREKQERFYEENEIKSFLTAFVSARRRYWKRDLAMVALILGSGLRASEVCGLKVRDYTYYVEFGVLFCKRKGGKICRVEVADFVRRYIDDYMATRGLTSANDPLFLSQMGGHLDRKTLWRTLSLYQTSADIDTGVHRLRHCVLTAVIEDSDIDTAAEVGNHRSKRTTKHYDHSKRAKRAVNGTIYAEMLGSQAPNVKISSG